MDTRGAYEAKTHLPQSLKQVDRGEKITFTKHGVPVATLRPPEENRKRPTKTVIQELLKFRKKNHLKGLTIREMIEENRQ